MTGEKGPRKPRRHQDSARAAPSVAERVAIVRRFLIARSWSTDQAEVLAAESGVSLVTVQAHAAEAQRQIEASRDLALVRERLDGLLLEAADAARQETRPAERARALCQVVREGRELAGIGAHRDPKNDPKPEEKAPAQPTGVESFLRPKKEQRPS